MTPTVDPLYGVSVWSTPHNSLWDDLEQVQRTGGRGVGLWEGKLPDGADEVVARRLRELGLMVTSAAPRIWTVFPVAWRSRVVYLDLSTTERDPLARAEAMVQSLARLARFEPRCVLVATGDASGMAAEHALDVLQRCMCRVCAAAESLGLRVGFELTSVRRGCPFRDLDHLTSFLDALPVQNVDVVLDVFHSGPQAELRDQVRRHVRRICGVHVNDVPFAERVWFDRVLPGQGRGVAVEVVAALLEAGFEGWYELEVFSDDGTFGHALPDSLWRMPHEELLQKGREAFEDTYRRARDLARARAGGG